MFLREVRFVDWPEQGGYPFNLPAFQGVTELALNNYLTFLVGENGSGKSTFLEALALACGFNAEGGNMGNMFSTAQTESNLYQHLKLAWLPKVTQGFFFRAESFFNFASYIDQTSPPDYRAYGGKSLHVQSHGESFLNLFIHRFRNRKPALYLLDEPEAALSPARQLAFLRILRDHQRRGNSQFIIATHSPILLAYPDARILNFDNSPLREVSYKDTQHYFITKRFLDAPEQMMEELFREDDEAEADVRRDGMRNFKHP
jgi:predicted ATPase